MGLADGPFEPKDVRGREVTLFRSQTFRVFERMVMRMKLKMGVLGYQ